MSPEEPNLRLVYARNPSRAHKLLPLLEGYPVISVRGLRDIFRLRRITGPGTVVIVDTLRRWALYGILAATVLRAPLIMRLRGEYFREERERVEAASGMLRWVLYYLRVSLTRLCFWWAGMFICNSRYQAEMMAPYIGKKPLAIVHNPITASEQVSPESEPPELPPDGFHLLTVANMRFYSKVQPTLDAISRWIPPNLWEDLDLHWVICGTGVHEDRIRNLVRQKGLGSRVHLLGHVKDIDLMYRWCDVLVHLTRIDSFPNVPMEAMMYGRPVITNVDSCGTREQVFDELNGFVVKDSETFLAALRAYKADPALRERHGREGRLLVERNFSVPVQRRAMQEALEIAESLAVKEKRA